MILDTKYRFEKICSKDAGRMPINNPAVVRTSDCWGRVYATNGRVAAWVDVSLEDPEVEGIVPLAALKLARKNATKRDVLALGLTKESARVFGQDTNTEVVPRPDYEFTWTKCVQSSAPTKPVKAVIALDAHQLALLADAMGAKDGIVTLHISDELSNVKVTARESRAEGLIAPHNPNR